MRRKTFAILLFLFVMLLNFDKAFAGKSEDLVWQEIDDARLKESSERLLVPEVYKTFKLNKKILNGILNKAPKEFDNAAQNQEVVLSFPLPDGTFSRFSIKNSPIMAPELAAKYPEINSYLGQGIDDPTATTRFDLSPVGLRVMILSRGGTVLIEPYGKGDTSNYITFNKSDFKRDQRNFECLVGNMKFLSDETVSLIENSNLPAEVINGATLRTYRLALAATGEYTTVFRQSGDTDPQAKARALAAMNTSMNRVNAVYERDVAVRMVLIANTDLLIYTDGATDPYTNTSGSTMLGQNQTNIDTVIGNANYDIGHVFSTGGGGVATLNSPCNSGTKARGVTGQGNPVGDPFDIDYVAHEMGHQFGAQHTFNGTTGSCAGGNRSAGAAYETGSGITIMAYAGICGAQDLARNSIDTFHVKSLEQIIAFIGGGGSCSANTATGNTPPTAPVTSATTYNIPKQTPFALSGASTDTNGDSITYDWQQFDLGAGTNAVPNTDSDSVARAILRPYLPTTGGTRTFPALTYILNNANVPPATYDCGRGTPCLTGELLPAITRTMNFQVVARDNRAGGGGINTTTIQVAVDGNSGPFNITSQNTPTNVPTDIPLNITWNVANTNIAPVNVANVRILLSYDGGLTFPTVLANSTPNDGSESVFVPSTASTTARIKVEAIGSVFFDINDANLTISPVIINKKLFDFDGDSKSDISLYRTGVWYLLRSTSGFIGVPFGLSTDKTVAADYDGDNKADIGIFRNGVWYTINSSNGAVNAFSWGLAGDVPVAGDYDGDSKADFTVFRNGTWYIRKSSDGLARIEAFGQAGDLPQVGDYDGDLKQDLAVYRSGVWYMQRSTLGFTAVSFGLASDVPVPADYDGDNKTDVAVYRGGVWYLLRSNLGFTGFAFGIAGDVPVPADYDGDGKSDAAVYRNGTWYLLQSTSGFTGVSFGLAGDKPIPAQGQ